MQTVLGYFDDRSQASQAIENLMDQGLISSNEAEIIDHTTLKSSPEVNSFGAQLSNFFSDIFREEPYDHYAEGVRRGDALVRIDTERDANHIAEQLQKMGAVDVDRRAEYFRSAGFDGFDAATAKPFSLTERDRYRADYSKWETSNRAQTGSAPEQELEPGKREGSRGGVKIIPH